MAETVTPQTRLCGAMTVHYRLIETVPGFRQRQVDLEHASAARLRSAAVGRARPITIPVVVHVVHNTTMQNMTGRQIRSQIAVLNRDFRARNPDKSKVPSVWSGLVADAGITFALATVDPAGNPTRGITRTPTDQRQFGDDDAVKFTASGGHDAWPASKYLNIWVCNLVPWLGYAQFPGGLPETDGLVILYTAFGTRDTAAPPFNLGRTATHEIGHWLNLRHIWGDTPDCSGSDFVDDTPNAEEPNFSKPSFPHVSCNNGPNGDMFMNYMDYVDDDSMFMFTPQQVARMHATLEGPRSAIGRP